MTMPILPSGNLGGLNPNQISVSVIAASNLEIGDLVMFDLQDTSSYTDTSLLTDFDNKRCPFNVVIKSPASNPSSGIWGVSNSKAIAGQRVQVMVSGLVEATVFATSSNLVRGSLIGPDNTGGRLTQQSTTAPALGIFLGVIGSPFVAGTITAGQQAKSYVLFDGTSAIASGSVQSSGGSGGSIEGVVVEGGTTTQLNYTLNSSANDIQNATTNGNVWSNVILGGGNTSFPNLINGNSSLRTIVGGYDNIIGRDANSFAGDGIATIASQILGGAHHRIFLNGDTTQSPTSIPVNTGATTQPTHSTIVGGSYNQIRNGDYNIIGGGNNCVIQEKKVTSDAAKGEGVVIGGGFLNKGYGNYAVIGGGNTNTVENRFSVIAGGNNNSILTPQDGSAVAVSSSTIGGGNGNIINCSNNATIAGGTSNKISNNSGTTQRGLSGFIGGGQLNEIGPLNNSTYASVVGGYNNIVDKHYGTIIGGSGNRINGQWSVGAGQDANSALWGADVFGGGAFSPNEAIQSSVLVLKAEAPANTTVDMKTQGNFLYMPTGTAWAFKCIVVGRAGTPDNAAFEISGAIKNVGGTASIIGTPPAVVVLGKDAGASTWTAVAAAGTAGNLLINVTGSATVITRWVARLELTEISYSTSQVISEE